MTRFSLKQHFTQSNYADAIESQAALLGDRCGATNGEQRNTAATGNALASSGAMVRPAASALSHRGQFPA